MSVQSFSPLDGLLLTDGVELTCASVGVECRATEVCTTPKTKRLFSCYVFANRTFVLFYNNIEIYEGVVNCGWRKLLDRNVKGPDILYSYGHQRAKD